MFVSLISPYFANANTAAFDASEPSNKIACYYTVNPDSIKALRVASSIFNLFITGFLITSYITYRVRDDLQLKYTKLTHDLFGIKKPQEENKEIQIQDPINSYCELNYRCPLSGYCKHATTMKDKKTIVKSKFDKEKGTCINYIYEGE